MKKSSESHRELRKVERQIQAPVPAEFRAVVDIGPRADHSKEARLCVAFPLPFTPSNRSSARQLRSLHDKIQRQIAGYLPDKGGFHAWLLDPQSNQPGLFVTGLLAVREGRCSKDEVEALNRRLLPQVTCEQTFESCEFLVRSMARASDYDDEDHDDEEWDGEDHDDEELDGEEYSVLDGAFCNFDHSELLDARRSDGCVDIFVETWHRFRLSLPFVPAAGSSIGQFRYIERQVTAAVYELAMCDSYEIEVEDCDFWTTDEAGNPSLFVSGLLRRKEGRLSQQKMKRREQELLYDLPDQMQKRCPAA